MRKEDCQYVKKCVYRHIAPANCGRVTLGDVYRLFSEYGNVGELEKCLDTFLKDGLAEKLVEFGEKIYVFRHIASKFEKKWREELDKLSNQREQAGLEKENIKNAISVLNELCNIWLEGWENAEKQLQPYLKNYVGSYWETKINEYIKKIKEIEQKILFTENEIRKIKNLIGES